MTTTSCVLCGHVGENEERCGFDLYHPCGMGQLHVGLERWGLDLVQRRWQEQVGTGELAPIREWLEIRVSFPTPVSARAFFRTEDGFDRLVQFFRHNETQSGDATFDHAVYVENARGTELERLLGNQGVQQAIMDLVGTGGVSLRDGCLVAKRVADDGYPSFEKTGVPLVLLAVHLEQFGRSA